MPSWGPVSRRKIIKALRGLGFDGPFSGGRHQFRVRGDLVLTIPNPHRGDVSVSLLAKILTHAGVTREDWESI